MSVIGHLKDTASAAVLTPYEKASIVKSIETMKSRLDLYFTDLKEHFQFGSSTRGTILPRSMDGNSDIDYMVVFNDGSFTPQTYLNWLKAFCEKYYSRSEIYQSSPTIVLELNHIKFELVPAIYTLHGGYNIPDGNRGWINTNPNDFNSNLTEKNKAESNLIKPTIRLVKYWNAENGYVYGSFLFEKWIINLDFSQKNKNQRDYLFHVFDMISVAHEKTKWRADKLELAKKIISKVRELENNGYPNRAEDEIKKLIQ